MKATLLLCFLLSFSYADNIHDVSRLEEVQVSKIAHVKDVQEIQSLVQQAIRENKKISIAGARHSQGGHVFYLDALVLDMTKFNRVLALNSKTKIMTVESGATWGDVQAYANKHGLAVKVMQASNIFTVGGSMSVNAHGRDPRFGSIVETIESFRLLTADGKIKNISRTENSEWFQLTIGGYGLFGVILDVDISLTENDVYRKKTKVIPWQEYPGYFLKNIKANKKIGLHFAWPSISRSNLLGEILIADYEKTDERPKGVFDLNEEGMIGMNKFFLQLSRKFDWGKSFRWFLQKNLIGYHGALIARNNAMRPEVKFLDYDSKKDTDILQEYFFPLDKYEIFVPALKKIFEEVKVNLLSITFRYVPPAKEPYLRYAGEKDMFAAVLYINQETSEEGVKKATVWTRKMVDLVLSVGGKYYLPYQRYPTREQIRKSYPSIDAFFAKKKAFDPKELFMNKFYEFYK